MDVSIYGNSFDKNNTAENILAWWNKEEEKSSAPPATSHYAIMQEQRRQAKKARQEAQELEPPQAQQYTSDNDAQNSPPHSQSESAQHSNTPHHYSQSQSPRCSNAPHHHLQSQVPRSPKYYSHNHDTSDEDDNALEDFDMLSQGAQPCHSSSQYHPTVSHNSRWQPLDSSTPSAPLQHLHRCQGGPLSSRDPPTEASSARQSKNKQHQHLESDGNHQPSNSLKKQKT
ncbi:hypothetical protein IW261DRAFT_1522240 [Armillaria novae-zelandiae]|uniref:Uncharacterized protein n=1 Tax=Armillaria novae-zelandiae TaxID=153914 RepID=A0AA39NHM5_9AGAR|nr:hypothetical protein IW261DRAFT_1522240 [Armillaria novae-zelandiae]